MGITMAPFQAVNAGTALTVNTLTFATVDTPTAITTSLVAALGASVIGTTRQSKSERNRPSSIGWHKVETAARRSHRCRQHSGGRDNVSETVGRNS